MGSSDSSGRKPDARQPPEYLVVGRIIRPHGLRGLMVFQPFSDIVQNLVPSNTVYLGSERIPVIIRDLQPYKARFLLSVEGCEDSNTAERWRGEDVRIRFGDAGPLTEDAYYHWQILDLQVVTSKGESLGKVAQILETGANDVYVVRDQNGVELLLPAIEEVILEVDLELSRMVVKLLPGLRPDSPS
jgi:16S rRNA processing protein RimM